ncbi:MAG: hypothetical protein PVG39_31965 [Desulfobacteraceae bacterium]|jgi:hypothetical protein
MLTSKQITEWEAFDRIDPIGDWKYNYYFAKLISVVVNIARCMVPRKKGSTPPKMTNPQDYIDQWYNDEDNRTGGEVQKQTAEDMINIFKKMGLKKGRVKKPIVNKKRQNQNK